MSERDQDQDNIPEYPLDGGDPVRQSKNGRWWFWCEHWINAHGPFETKEEARAAVVAYAATL